MKRALDPACRPLALAGCVVETVAKTAVDVVTLPVKVASAGVDAVDHEPDRSRPEARPRAAQAGRGAGQAGPHGAGALPQGQAAADRQLRSGRAALRYFLDTEYNGWGGALLSLALVPDDGEELYLTLDWDGPLEEWVERNVVPYLDMVPDS